MALREVVDEFVFDLLPRKGFNWAQIPPRFVSYEPDPDRLCSSWENFRTAVTHSCKCRRPAVFVSAVERHCQEFSLRMENVKVSFAVVSWPQTKKRNKKGPGYSVTLCCLSDIPQECRNVQFCVAEIPPPPEPEVVAELVSSSELLPSLVAEGSATTADWVEILPQDGPSGRAMATSTGQNSSLLSQQQQQQRPAGLHDDSSMQQLVPVARLVLEEHTLTDRHLETCPSIASVPEDASAPATEPFASCQDESSSLERLALDLPMAPAVPLLPTDTRSTTETSTSSRILLFEE